MKALLSTVEKERRDVTFGDDVDYGACSPKLDGLCNPKEVLCFDI